MIRSLLALAICSMATLPAKADPMYRFTNQTGVIATVRVNTLQWDGSGKASSKLAGQFQLGPGQESDFKTIPEPLVGFEVQLGERAWKQVKVSEIPGLNGRIFVRQNWYFYITDKFDSENPQHVPIITDLQWKKWGKTL